jgi:hypothetical protein
MPPIIIPPPPEKFLKSTKNERECPSNYTRFDGNTCFGRFY